VKLLCNLCEICSLLGYYTQETGNTVQNSTDVSGQYICPIFEDQENWTEILSRNFRSELPVYTMQYARRGTISYTSQVKTEITKRNEFVNDTAI